MSGVDGVATRATAQGASAVLTACLTFVVLTALAMLEYPGGSLHPPGTHHYIFSENFLGDLGVTKTAAGFSNTSSCVLFVIAMTCVGISLIAFAGSWHAIAESRGIPVRTAWVYKWSATGSGLCFLGVGLTPWNLLPSVHKVLAWAAFALLAVFVVALVDVQRLNRWPKRYVLANSLYLAVMATYVLILVSGQSTSTHGGLVLQVASQKIMVCSSILNLGFQAYGIRKALRPSRAAVQTAHR
jgi:hypothetical protein